MGKRNFNDIDGSILFSLYREGILAVYQKIKYIRNRAEKGNTGSYNITKDGKSL
jgi:hypothetical protein